MRVKSLAHNSNRCLVLLLLVMLAPTLHAQQAAVKETIFEAVDSEQNWTDKNPQTQAVLEQFKWETGAFKVRCTATPWLPYDALVRFDSPMPSGQRWVDEVVMQWYAARDELGNPVEAPAVLLVHSLHPRMVFANTIAQSFAKRGLHTFVIQLPGYGMRWEGERRYPGITALEHGRQSITDCLRARDAIAVLPNIRPGPIALQGTSLGGFVAATVGGVEPEFKPVILLISGADSYNTLMNGLHDAMHLRLALEQLGYRDDTLRKLLDPVEPIHVAHRLDPANTWLITARDDMTIPRANSDALAAAVGLDGSHRLWLNANHYTAVILLQAVTDGMANIILEGKPEDFVPEPVAPADH